MQVDLIQIQLKRVLTPRFLPVLAAEREYLLQFMITFVKGTLTEISFNEKIADGI